MQYRGRFRLTRLGTKYVFFTICTIDNTSILLYTTFFYCHCRTSEHCLCSNWNQSFQLKLKHSLPTPSFKKGSRISIHLTQSIINLFTKSIIFLSQFLVHRYSAEEKGRHRKSPSAATPLYHTIPPSTFC